MEHRIAAEHHGLRVLLEEALDRVSDADRAASIGRVDRLRDALAVHFEQEDRLYYPTVGALRPRHAAAVTAFAAGHERFLGELAEIAAALAAGELARAEQELAAFRDSFALHEAAEEELLRSLEAELTDAR